MGTKRFVIYRFSEDPINVTSQKELGSVTFEENRYGDVFKAEFYLTYGKYDEPIAIECDIKVSLAVSSSWTDEIVNRQVQSGLHHGIYLVRDILPLNENAEYVFYRHGNDMCDWIRGLVKS